jgi:4-diphosphocytidyl-2-C-methyl-D-erythritol kinase
MGVRDFPSGENIITRAVALFRERTGFDRSLRVRIAKRIPLGGGLGGGSSDGASTLLALNALAGTALSPVELVEMGLQLGSDVPFFLSGGTALVTGRGECIRPLGRPRPCGVVLVNPGFSSGTREAFGLLDAWREGTLSPSSGADWLSNGESRLAALEEALREPPVAWTFGNDFLFPFLEAGDPEARRAYGDIMTDFAALGAEFSGLPLDGDSALQPGPFPLHRPPAAA